MQKLFNVTSNDQNGGVTAGEINVESKPKKQTFWDKPIIKYVLLPVLVGLIIYFLTRQSMADNIFTVTSNNQQGGLTVGQLNVGTPPRHLSDEIKKQLERMSKKPVKMIVIGSHEANQYATEIKTFLESKGWKVDPNFYLSYQPAFGIDIRDQNPQQITIIVGSAS